MQLLIYERLRAMSRSWLTKSLRAAVIAGGGCLGLLLLFAYVRDMAPAWPTYLATAVLLAASSFVFVALRRRRAEQETRTSSNSSRTVARAVSAGCSCERPYSGT